MGLADTGRMSQVTSDDVVTFLKKYSSADDAFVEDFFSFVDPLVPDTHSVDLDKASKWLRVPKFNLMKTLKSSYAPEVDFVVSKPAVSLKGRGRNTRRIVMLTPDAFKTLCMQSRSSQADRVRAYFLAVEKALVQYRAEVVEGLKARVDRLELNQKPLDIGLRKAGLIYVLPAGGASLYKIGRTRDLATRLRSHGSAHGDALHPLETYKTEDVEEVEACVKAVLKKDQYRKYKEVYQAELDVINTAIMSCAQAVKKVQATRSGKKATALGGGGSNTAFIVFVRNEHSMARSGTESSSECDPSAPSCGVRRNK